MKNGTHSRPPCLAFALLIMLCLGPPATAQYVPRQERGDPTARLRTEMDGNTIRTSVFNFAFSGRTGVDQGIPYEWPINTQRMYIALVGLFVGGSVIDTAGTTIHIVDLPAFRTNPANGSSWNLEPVNGYSSPPQIARSDDPASWPSFWPDKQGDLSDPGWAGRWNGFFGKDVRIDGVEMYYHCSDDLYNRYSYFPDSTDLTRRGLGLVISQRVLAWNSTCLDSAIVFVSDIWNAGTKSVETAAATLWVADFLGGDGDSMDDLCGYDVGAGCVYFTDADGVSPNPAFAGAPVGTVGLVLLETPEQKGLTNVHFSPAGAINFSTTPDIFYWTEMMMPGQFDIPSMSPEIDVFASTGYFPLPAGTFQRLTYAFVFGSTVESRNRNIRYLKAFHAGGFQGQPFTLTITSPAAGAVVSGTTELRWNANANDPTLAIDISYSSDNGASWTLVAEQEPNDGVYQFNTTLFPDGVYSLFRIVAYGPAGLASTATPEPFTINNPVESPPQVILQAPVAGSLQEYSMSVEWIAGDPEGATVELQLYLRKSGDYSWTAVNGVVSNTGLQEVRVESLANAKDYTLRIVASDGVLLGADTVDHLEFRTPRYGLDDTAYVSRATVGTGSLQPHIVDPALANEHIYRVTFRLQPDTSTVYDVYDETASLPVLTGAREIHGDSEGPLFDGVRLLIRSDSAAWNPQESGWTRPEVDPLSVRLFRYQFTVGRPMAADFEIRVGDAGMDTSEPYLTFPAKPVNFTVTNLTTGASAPFALIESDGSDGMFTAQQASPFYSDAIVLLHEDSPGVFTAGWSISLAAAEPGGNPSSGDVATARFFKPFQDGDTYRFQALPGFLLGLPPETAQSFDLEQNFPNPFNPATTIRVRLAGRSQVTLDVFNTLGQQVARLIEGEMEAGPHDVTFDASRLSSGVYFYRLRAHDLSTGRAGDVVRVRKMLLLR